MLFLDKKNNGKILEVDEPKYIKAEHEKISGKLGHISIVDWSKIIEINLNQEFQDTMISINIDPKEKSKLDNYDNRIKLWPIIVGKILFYVGAEIDDKDVERLFPKRYYINQIRREKIVLLFSILIQILSFFEFIRSNYTEISLLFVIMLFFILENRFLKNLDEIYNEMKKIYSNSYRPNLQGST